MTNNIVKRLLCATFTLKLSQSLRHEVQHLSDLQSLGPFSEDLTEGLDEPRPVYSVSVGHVSRNSGVSYDHVRPAVLFHLHAARAPLTIGGRRRNSVVRVVAPAGLEYEQLGFSSQPRTFIIIELLQYPVYLNHSLVSGVDNSLSAVRHHHHRGHVSLAMLFLAGKTPNLHHHFLIGKITSFRHLELEFFRKQAVKTVQIYIRSPSYGLRVIYKIFIVDNQSKSLRKGVRKNMLKF